MRKPRAFHPSDLESLEGRVVLSSTSFTINFGNSFQHILTQLRDVRATNHAFATFRQSFNNDIKTILLKADTGGTIDPAANRAAFDAKVLTDIQALNTTLAAKVKGINSTTLATSIQNKLLGSDPKSLESRLSALSTPTDSKGFSLRVFRLNSSLAMTIAQNQVDSLIHRARVQARNTSTSTSTSSSVSIA